MADQALLFLINDVRGKTLKILTDLNDEQARFSAPGLANSILWHAGHSLIVNEHLGVAGATGKAPHYPDGWFDKFSWKSQPATIKEWPKLAEVVMKLTEQQSRLVHAVEGLSEQQLNVRIGDPTTGRTLRHSILHGMHDEANHQGEMWLLKKMLAKRSK